MRDIALPQTIRSKTARTHTRRLKWKILAQDRSLPHLERKLYHFLMGLGCFSLYAFLLDRTQGLVVLGVVGGCFLAGDIARLYSPKLNSWTVYLFGRFMRREELKSITGNSFYVLGLFVLMFFFPKPIVLLSIVFLAVGDPVAAIAGTFFGRRRLWGKKTAEGALANGVASALATFVVGSRYFHLNAVDAGQLAVIGGMISLSAEAVVTPLDDNFTIPVLSALLLTVFEPILPILN